MENLEMIKPKRVQNIINKFCLTIGMLPTSYKISMTYEEQILAIGHYLETTVYPAINNNAEALAELQNLFIELKNYVDNYFDDLDIQAEINNKLDDMAQSDELAEIIAQYIELQGLLCYDTVNDMKNAGNLVNGSFAKTYGFYTKNDGGGSFYKIRTVTNEDVVNNMNLIALSNDNSLVAELMTDIVNVLQFGAKGDGITNDTLALQTASNYAQEKQLEFYVPEKTFKSNALSFTLIPIITIKGNISAIEQNTEFLFDYAGLNSAPIININKMSNYAIIKMLGVESGEVNIRRAYKLLLTTDENEDRRHTSQCYNTFNLGFINQLEIYVATQGGYINENLFVGGRFASIYLHGDGTFSPSENTFMKCFSEDTSINIAQGKNNIFHDIRAEGLQNITCGENAIGNVFHRTWGSRTGVSMRSKYNNYVIDESTDNAVNLNGKNMFELNKSIEHIAFSINVFNNPANLNKYGTTQDTLIVSGTNNVYKSSIVRIPDTSFGLTFVADNKNFEYIIQMFDDNGNLLTEDPLIKNDSPIFTWNSSKNGYVADSSAYNAYWILMTPNANAKYMRVIVNGRTTGTKGFLDLKCYLNYYSEPRYLKYILDGLNTYDAN